MKILVDMCLSPEWTTLFIRHGIEAVHWSSVGNIRAKDSEIFRYAREHDCIVFTHDLDFGVLLAFTGDSGPSVIQVRTRDPFPETIGYLVISVIKTHLTLLEKGAILTIDKRHSRIRILPI